MSLGQELRCQKAITKAIQSQNNNLNPSNIHNRTTPLTITKPTNMIKYLQNKTYHQQTHIEQKTHIKQG